MRERQCLSASRISILLVCFLFSAARVFCGSGPAKETAELTKLAEGVYVQVVSPDGNAVSNSGVVILDHGVLVFDTHFTPEAGQVLLAGIRSLTSKPVRYVVNSHFHPDHTHGNQVWANAQLIASTNARRDVLQVDLPSMNRAVGITQDQLETMRRDMEQEADSARIQSLRAQIKLREDYLETMSRLKIIAPIVTLDDGLTILEGKREVQILYFGAGHTDGDVVLYLPSLKIAFLGDLFFNKAIPNVQDASVLEWMKTLEEVLKLDAEKFLPGHGPVGSKNDVKEFLGYLEELKTLIEAAIARGDTMEQTTHDTQVPPKYSSYQFQNFFPSNVQKMYTELKASQLASIPAEGPRKSEREKAKR
jgi:cyclase